MAAVDPGADTAAGRETPAALELRGLGKTFESGGRRIRALNEVNLRARRARVTGLIGPDGAGKTTIMRLAAGLLAPDAGTITVLGTDVAADPLAVQAMVGYMPQRFGLYEDLTVQENLDLYADLQGVPRADRAARYDMLIGMTGLGEFAARLAGRLSGGMKQKLGLACTLIRTPRLLLLDEPTVGVDPVSRRELWSIVDRLVTETHTSVFLSTAYLDEAERCHEVVLLHEGRVLGRGRPADFAAPLAGRTWRVTAPGVAKRRLQRRVAEEPRVLDAVVDGEGVRVLLDEHAPSALDATLRDVDGVTVQPVQPRFEDGFVALLEESRTRPRDAKRQAAASPAIARRPEDSSPVIEVEHAQRRFGDFYAVKDVTFEVRRGEVFGLLGANGAGKSTTFRMLCGLLPVSAGRVRVAGLDLRRAAADARARIGYMAQKFSLYGNLDVLENLEFFAGVYGLSGRRRSERVAWALEQFDLGALRDTPGDQLALGYQQRLALACALMHEPEIVFLDEPTSGVDPIARREFWARINDLADSGVTILITTHFMEEAEYCDRLAIMAAGEILTLGVSDEIKQAARSAEVPQPTLEDAFIGLIDSRMPAGGIA